MVLGQINMNLQILAEKKIKKMMDLACGTYVCFTESSKYKDKDLWEMKKILISLQDRKLVVQNLHSWSTDFTVIYDCPFGTNSLGQDKGSFNLQPDGYLLFEEDPIIRVNYSLAMETDSTCKLVMSGMKDNGVKYSKSLIWSNNGVLHQTVKLGTEEDVRVFKKVFLDAQHYLVVNEDSESNSEYPYPSVDISPTSLVGLSLSTGSPVAIQGTSRKLVTRINDMNKPKTFSSLVSKDQHVRVARDLREFLEIERGEVVKLEPVSDIPLGKVTLKVTSVNRITHNVFNLNEPISFERLVDMYLGKFPGPGVIFNKGLGFQLPVWSMDPEFMKVTGLMDVEFLVLESIPSPACLVSSINQVEIIE